MAQQQLDETIRSTPVVVFTQPGCPYCARIELLFTALDTKLGASKFVSAPGDSELRAALRVKVSATSVPQVFVGGQHLGGHDDLRQLIESASAAGSFGNKLDQAGALAEAAGSHAAAEADQTAAEEVRK